MSTIPRTAAIAVTPGEPAGIGPDLVLALAADAAAASIVVIADPDMLAARARHLGLDVRLEIVHDAAPATPAPPDVLRVHPVRQVRQVRPGHPEAANAPALLEALDIAVDGCLAGRYAALVTGPLNKAVINDAGIAFTGHTEYLAARCGGQHPVMLLAGGGLRVALVTTHLALRNVADGIDAATLERVLHVLHTDLQRRFAIAQPRIMVLGLNPHAGEGGHLGDEEIRVIVPVLDKLRGRGFDLIGPVPADTAFNPERLRGIDAVLAMYHDQGLPVLKYASFGSAVNITLGLPIIRTSVDHGTAFDLAGSGRADAGSLREAIASASRMAAGAG
jgi:4-hydroxythreonine-4-phosphate dehydrogenase